MRRDAGAPALGDLLAVSPARRAARHERPSHFDVLAGIRRAHGRPPAQKEAIFADDLLAMLATLEIDLRGIRDRAILAIGFAGGLRRSEIVGLDCGPDQTEDATGWIEIFVGFQSSRAPAIETPPIFPAPAKELARIYPAPAKTAACC